MFAQPFNQATFVNYDTNFGVTILDTVLIPRATISSGIVTPAQFKLNLNTGEVNGTAIKITIPASSTTANLVVIYTQYDTVN